MISEYLNSSSDTNEVTKATRPELLAEREDWTFLMQACECLGILERLLRNWSVVFLCVRVVGCLAGPAQTVSFSVKCLLQG